MRILQTIILITLIFSASPARGSEEIIFIVNAANPQKIISKDQVREFYFKRVREWPDGESVRFIDRNASSDIRKSFLVNIIRKTAVDVDMYWLSQQVHSGSSPPLQEKSDSLTIHFVSIFKGALGYVAPGTKLPKTVKVLKVEL